MQLRMVFTPMLMSIVFTLTPGQTAAFISFSVRRLLFLSLLVTKGCSIVQQPLTREARLIYYLDVHPSLQLA